MRISIVTPSYNQGEFIEDTIRSVLDQDHEDVEHLVMDGGSTDSTRSVLARYSHLKWTSERDGGQACAINKGFRQATGEILAWLNSDDYYEPNVLGDVARYFGAHPDCMILFGDITFVDRDRKPLFGYSGDGISYQRLIACPEIVRQPSMFWRRDVVRELGGVDESLHLVMDFDFFLRIGARYPFHHLARNLSCYRYYVENKSLSMARRQLREIYRVYRKNGVPFTWPVIRFLLSKSAHAYGLAPFLRPLARLAGTGGAPR
jgi:glycosyltransferase involved in cell wall biosynthesis